MLACRSLPSRSADVQFVLKRFCTGAAIVSSLALGACSGASNPFDFASVAEKPAAKSDVETGTLPQTELQKATEYWGKKYEAEPRNAQHAINYVRNLKALNAKEQAMQVIQQAYSLNSGHKGIASEYGRLALEMDQIAIAEKLLAQADDPVAPDWKVISARGTVLAKQSKYRDAIPFFERALAMAPTQPSLLNNLALAYAMDGQADKAEPLLRQAAQDNTADPKVARNLSLVLGLQGKSDEAKSVLVRSAPASDANEDVAIVKQMVGTTAPVQQASIVTGSTQASKVRSKTAAVAKSQPKTTPVAEDASTLVQRLADGYAATPADAPVQLGVRR